MGKSCEFTARTSHRFSVASPFHLIPQLSWTLPTLHLFELVTVIIFSVEYVLRVWSAEHPLRYVFRGMALLIWRSNYSVLHESLLQTEIASWSLLFLRILRILKLGQIYSTERDILLKNTRVKHGTFETLDNER